MQLPGLTRALRQSEPYQTILDALQPETDSTLSVIRAARPFLFAALTQDWQGPVIYLTSRGRRAYNVAEQLPVWMSDTDRVIHFAEPTPMFYDRLPWEADVIQARLEALAALIEAETQPETPPVIIASARALMQRTLPPRLFRRQMMTLKPGDRVRMDTLIDRWLAMGYEPVTMVVEPGTFTRRGGLLDIYPTGASLPVRIDFFDVEIDTLRAFDPATQRTVDRLQAVSIVPAREALPEQLPQVAAQLAQSSLAITQQDLTIMQQAQSFNTMEHYLPWMYPNPVSVLDYAPPNSLIVVDDPESFRQSLQELADEAATNRENNIKTKQLDADFPLPFVSPETLLADLESHTVLWLQSGDDAETSGGRLFVPGGRFGGQLRPALSHLREQRDKGDRLVVVTQQPERLRNLWYEQDTSAFIPKLDTLETMPQPRSLTLLEGTLAEGWMLNQATGNLHLVTDAELFNWSRPEPRRRKATAKRAGQQLPEASYADWHEGDYVVHVDYGVGRFAGMMARTVEGHERDYLKVEYAENDLVFVPVHQSDRLTRWVGTDDKPPKLSRPGKPLEWRKRKDKARRDAEEEARELLDIYARRAGTQGHAFAPDTPWQYELEASFPYVETEDQLRVLRDVKADMEQSTPMDRLVCGDVGYGKTEVALRAAFKAVMDGKQVAILVPTTVLAQQHYETFKRRMDPFPVNVELLSRFRTKAQQSQILTQLASGQIDIIIGTHRLLSVDITLEDAGLIIIDEEQRFGVKHKEHFKKLRAHVDILTLTATPIPRTLYMSLSGVRDISMIQTPPEERLPVITHSGPFDEKLARQAILRELDRGGQVFVIHNRVRTIGAVRDRFEELVPEASIVIAHGQMSGRQLEQVISDFSHGTYDILLATSIIENGIDMPNVNTLIVDRADWFGMSQLYQIRGRVGRSAQQAYCYFFHAGGRLTEEAKARLDTLAEHTDLGAGFQIAVRDMELRGTGDMLSTRQSGHIASVGLQLYSQLLRQAVSRLKGDPEAAVSRSSDDDARVIIDLPLPSYIPSDWIPEMALRLQLYRRIGNLTDLEAVDAMEQELIDRFGILPLAVEGLLYQIRVKILAQVVNATAVQKPRAHILIKLPWLMAVDRDALAQELGGEHHDIEVSRTAVELAFDDDLWRLRLIDVLMQLREGLPEQVGTGM